MKESEDDLHCNLDLTRRSGSVGLGIGAGNHSKPRLPDQIAERGSIGSWIEEVRVVEDIVAFEAQFRLHPLRNAHSFGNGHVPVPEPRPVPLIAFIVGRLPKGRIDESALIADVGKTRPRC